MHPDLLTIGERSVQALEAWQGAYASIQNAGVNTDAPNAHTPGTAVSDINARATGALSGLSRLRDASPERLELISQRLQSLKDAVDTIETQSNALNAALEPCKGATSSDSNGHLQLQMQHPEKGAQDYDLGAPLAAIGQQCAVALDALPCISQVLGDGGIPVSVLEAIKVVKGEP